MKQEELLMKQEELLKERQEELLKEQQEELLKEQQELFKKRQREGISYLILAIHNLEYLNKTKDKIPEDLQKFVEVMTSQLLIKAGQNIPSNILEKMEIPKEYIELINYKEQIQPMRRIKKN